MPSAFWLAAGALVTFAGLAARADPAPHGLCSGVYVAATLLSDYRFDGFSESDRQPTWQVNVHCYRTDGWYAGTVLTGVDFEERPSTRLETDFYAGRHVAVAGSDLNLELLYYAFPDKRAPGPTYDSVALEAELTRKLGHLTIAGHADWTPQGSSHTGVGGRLRGTAAYALTPWLEVSGHVGRLWSERGQERTFWDVGAKATWRRLTLDVRYGGTDLKPSQCYFTRWCEPGPSAGLTWRLLP